MGSRKGGRLYPGHCKRHWPRDALFFGKGDSVIIQPPVYHPFRLVTERNGRVVVNHQLQRNGTVNVITWISINWKMFLKRRRCLCLFCPNPHNPGGTVWDRETLTTLAGLCYKFHVTVISDEIHADMALFGNKHIPFTTVSQEAEQAGIVYNVTLQNV